MSVTTNTITIQNNNNSRDLPIPRHHCRPGKICDNNNEITTNPDSKCNTTIFYHCNNFRNHYTSSTLRVRPLLVRNRPTRIKRRHCIAPRNNNMNINRSNNLTKLLNHCRTITIRHHRDKVNTMPLMRPIIRNNTKRVRLVSQIPIVMLSLRIRPTLIRTTLYHHNVFLIRCHHKYHHDHARETNHDTRRRYRYRDNDGVNWVFFRPVFLAILQNTNQHNPRSAGGLLLFKTNSPSRGLSILAFCCAVPPLHERVGTLTRFLYEYCGGNDGCFNRWRRRFVVMGRVVL